MDGARPEFIFAGYVPHLHLHSFPTRRSSDLFDAWSSVRPIGERSRPIRTTSPRVPNVTTTRHPTRNGCTHGSSNFNCSPERSEEHTSELQSHVNLVCRLLLEKKNSI